MKLDKLMKKEHIDKYIFLQKIGTRFGTSLLFWERKRKNERSICRFTCTYRKK